MFWLPAAGLAMGAAGLGYSIFGGKKVNPPDISAELNKIGELFAQARASAIAGINQQAAQGRSQQVSNMAARGTYRSPVAQNVFNALESARLQSIGAAEGSLAGQEAQARGSALGPLMNANMASQQAGQQQQASIGSAIGSFGGSLFNYGMNSRPTQQVAIQPNSLFGSGDIRLNATGIPQVQTPYFYNQYNSNPFAFGGSSFSPNAVYKADAGYWK